MAAWAMPHGLVSLLVDGQLSPGTQALEDFAFRVVQYLFLGVRNDAPGRRRRARGPGQPRRIAARPAPDRGWLGLGAGSGQALARPAI